VSEPKRYRVRIWNTDQQNWVYNVLSFASLGDALTESRRWYGSKWDRYWNKEYFQIVRTDTRIPVRPAMLAGPCTLWDHLKEI